MRNLFSPSGGINFMRNQLSAILTGAVALALWQGTAQAISLNLVPSPQTTFLGNTIDVAVTISDLGNGVAPSLSTYDLDISFDNTILDFNSVAFGDPVLGDQLDLFLGSLTESEEPSLGVVNLFELSLDLSQDLDSFQADSFTLATLTFDTIATGISPLNLSIVDLGDAFGAPLEAEAEVDDRSVTVSSRPLGIPEPSFSLVGFGLTVGLGALLSKCNGLQ
jgi:hypothetical protein